MKEIAKNFLFEYGHIFIGIITFPIIVTVADCYGQWKMEQKIEKEKSKITHTDHWAKQN